MKIDYQQLPTVITHRLGPLLLLIGLVSIIQAAGLFPIGTSSYPEALILLNLGGLLTLGAVSSSSSLAKVGQSLFAIAAICLIVIF